ncbi:MAG: hypothetical protein MUO77_01110 [Anaerolineales bacterium]|nr:hypothetical protein [Anaerolineales bacterium]
MSKQHLMDDGPKISTYMWQEFHLSAKIRHMWKALISLMQCKDSQGGENASCVSPKAIKMHMQKNKFPFPTLAVLAFVAAVGISSWILPGTIVPLQQVLPTSTPIAMTPTEDSWIIVDLPEDAIQPGSELNSPGFSAE